MRLLLKGVPVVALLLSLMFLMEPGIVYAQAGIDRFSEEACVENPHSEACICVAVRRYGQYPRGYDSMGTPTPVDVGGSLEYPVFLEEERVWVGIPAVYNPDTDQWEGGNLVPALNDRYGQHCALSYVREDLRRLWYFLAAVGGLLAAMSFAWAGVMYMQDSASGGDISRSRAVMVRVVIGMVFLGSSVLVWENLSGLLVSHLDTWTLNFDRYYEF